MSRVFGQTPAADIDALLQDSYLLVVELQQKAAPKDGEELWKHCVAQVEQCRNHLMDTGVSQRAVNQIGYAQCALLDETVLRNASAQAHSVWAAKPLQAHFFNRHQAGEQLYEDMREALAEPAPDLRVLTCYQRVLMLGFLGRHRSETAPEREQLLALLNQHVEPFAPANLPVLVSSYRGSWRRWLSMPWLHLTVASVLLIGLWLVLHRVLGNTVSSLLAGQI